MKGPGDFLSCIKSTSFKRQSPFKYNVFLVYIWNFFLSRFWCHFILGLVFLGVNCDQIFLTKPRLPVSLSYLTVSCFFSLQEQFQFRKGKDGHYIAHIQHMEIGLVLFKWRWWYIDILPGTCSMLKINFFQTCFTWDFSLNPTSLVRDNSHFNTASFHFIWQIALTGSSCNKRLWWCFILPKQEDHLPKAGG